MCRYTILLLTAVLLIGCKSTVEPSGEQAASEEETTAKAEPFMGLPDDQEKPAETEDGDEYIAVTKVLSGHYDTYEYLNCTGQIIAEQRREGRIYFAARHKLEVGLIIAGDDTPRPTVDVTRRYRCKIPEGQPGFSTNVLPDRVNERIPYTDEAIFANFAPESFALMCESMGLAYKTDSWTFADSGFVWAARRAVERGEATCAVLTDHGLSSRQIEEGRADSWYSYRKRHEEPNLRMETIEADHWWRCPQFMPSTRYSQESPVDIKRQVLPNHIVWSVLARSEFGWASRFFRDDLEEIQKQQPENANEKRKWISNRYRALCEPLTATDAFVAGDTLVARGVIPPDKQELYERACRKAAFVGSYWLRRRHVDAAAIEMGVYEKSPQDRADALELWQAHVDYIQQRAEENGENFGFLCFPGPRPWMPSAAEALGLDSALSQDDLLNEESLPQLVVALDSDDVETRREAAWGLVRLSISAAPASGSLLRALNDEDQAVRRYAACAFTRIGESVESPADATKALARTLKTDSWFKVRRQSAQALGKLGVTDPEIVGALVTAAEDDVHEAVRDRAVQALGELAAASQVAQQSLLNLLRSDDSSVVLTAIYALGQLEEAPAGAAGSLAELLDHKEHDVRIRAAEGLVELDPDCERLLPMLIAELDSTDRFAPRTAARDLGRLGGRAAPAIPRLIEALEDDDDQVRLWASSALAQIGIGEDEVTALQRLLSHEMPGTRAMAARALCDAMVPDKGPIIAAVLPCLEDEDTDVRWWTAIALRGLHTEAEAALPTLRKVAREDPDPEVRATALVTAEKIEAAIETEKASAALNDDEVDE
ncbi:MAG: HEAT repeat domain-containing protein [Planctomycetota bacterium]|jgi:HEAT repeat protein